MTDEVIRWHLSGRDGAGRDFVMGAYPMLLDETCFFLAADFDKDFSPYPDQWAFLATAGKISQADAEAIVRDAEGKGQKRQRKK